LVSPMIVCVWITKIILEQMAMAAMFATYVHQALQETIMKPDTSQDTSWTWLQRAQGPKHEAGKLQGPGQKMLNLARQGALSKPWGRRRQGPTCIREQVNNWPRSVGERTRAEPGQKPLCPLKALYLSHYPQKWCTLWSSLGWGWRTTVELRSCVESNWSRSTKSPPCLPPEK
jgi:hypothetical protein